jgi:hypothetical protein
LAGIYFMIQDTTKAKFHLSNACVWILIITFLLKTFSSGGLKAVQTYIAKYKR